MTFGVGYRIPDNSILRKGTLIIGVTKRDPKVPAVKSLEETVQKQIAEQNGGTEQSQKSESTTCKPRGDR